MPEVMKLAQGAGLRRASSSPIGADSRLPTLKAARMKDAGERSDLEAGMSKLFVSEAGQGGRPGLLPPPQRLRYSKERRSSSSSATRRCC